MLWYTSIIKIYKGSINLSIEQLFWFVSGIALKVDYTAMDSTAFGFETKKKVTTEWISRVKSSTSTFLIDEE